MLYYKEQMQRFQRATEELGIRPSQCKDHDKNKLELRNFPDKLEFKKRQPDEPILKPRDTPLHIPMQISINIPRGNPVKDPTP